jgi:GT2 family glycosyltransferase
MLFLKDISFLVPFKSDNGYRDKIFKWILTFYEKYFPNAEICIGSSISEPFSRSEAINNAALKSTKNIFVIVDSDLIYDPTIIKTSIELLNNNSWVVPYNFINYLSQSSTEHLLTTPPTWPLRVNLDAPKINYGKIGVTGGICIIPRKNFQRVRGFDTRFIGWGGEDDAFAFAVNTLCGKYTRLDGQIFHLWHPSKQAAGNPHYHKNVQLYNRYKMYDGSKVDMLNLIRKRYHT